MVATKHTIPRLESPPNVDGPHPGSNVDAAVALAKANPGEWVLASEDSSPGNAPTWKKRGVLVRASYRDMPKRRCKFYIMWEGE